MEYYERIGYKGELLTIAKQVCRIYGLGKCQQSTLIEIGYADLQPLTKEDCE